MSRAEISRRALELFARRGFDETTVDEVAAEFGLARRTLFRYFASKTDMVWGDFDWVLDRLRRHFEQASPDEPLMDALARAVIGSNHYEADQLPELRIRMRMITTVPTLQAHSMVRYAEWRNVVAAFAAARCGQRIDDLLPLTIAHAALGTSMAAFVRWVNHPEEDLGQNLRQGYRMLTTGFSAR